MNTEYQVSCPWTRWIVKQKIDLERNFVLLILIVIIKEDFFPFVRYLYMIRLKL